MLLQVLVVESVSFCRREEQQEFVLLLVACCFEELERVYVV
jgi:hypothetical protein